MTSLNDSHRMRISSLKWFPKGFFLHKGLLQFNSASNEVALLASLGEDGQILIWDMKNFEHSVENDVNTYIKYIRVEVNKVDGKRNN